MEINLINSIKENFFKVEEELIESSIKEQLINLRKNFKIEIGGPGCTPCKMNAARKKYNVMIDNIINNLREDDIIN